MASAQVSVTESFAVDAHVDQVWRLLIDPAVIVSCMPGTEIIEEHADGSIEGRMRVKLGPTVVDFGGVVSPDFDDATRRGTLVARGADRTGRTRAQATVDFSVEAGDDDGGGGSIVVVDGTIDVSGGLATFVRTGGAHLARRMIADFAEAFGERCEQAIVPPLVAGRPDLAVSTGAGRPGATAPPPEPPAAAPVNGLRLLAGVVRDTVRAWWARARRGGDPGAPRRTP